MTSTSSRPLTAWRKISSRYGHSRNRCQVQPFGTSPPFTRPAGHGISLRRFPRRGGTLRRQTRLRRGSGEFRWSGDLAPCKVGREGHACRPRPESREEHVQVPHRRDRGGRERLRPAQDQNRRRLQGAGGSSASPLRTISQAADPRAPPTPCLPSSERSRTPDGCRPRSPATPTDSSSPAQS